MQKWLRRVFWKAIWCHCLNDLLSESQRRTWRCAQAARDPPPPPSVSERDSKRGEMDRRYLDSMYTVPALRYHLKTSKKRGETKGITPPPLPRQTKVWSTNGECMLTAWCRRCTSSSGHLSVKPSEAWPWFDSPTLSANYYTRKNGFDVFPLFAGTNGIPLLINTSGGFQLSLVSDGPRGRWKSQSLFAM